MAVSVPVAVVTKLKKTNGCNVIKFGGDACYCSPDIYLIITWFPASTQLDIGVNEPNISATHISVASSLGNQILKLPGVCANFQKCPQTFKSVSKVSEFLETF